MNDRRTHCFRTIYRHESGKIHKGIAAAYAPSTAAAVQQIVSKIEIGGFGIIDWDYGCKLEGLVDDINTIKFEAMN